MSSAHGKDPMVVLKNEYTAVAAALATVRMKLKSLIGSFLGTRSSSWLTTKIDRVILDKRDCTYLHFADPIHLHGR
jgi:elongation factor P